MNKFIIALTVLISSVIYTPLFAQDSELLISLPTSKEEFVKSEPYVINTIDWLETNPRNQNEENRKLLVANLVAWITNSPTVTIELNSKTTPFTKKNNELLIYFMGGWVRYALQNNYSADVVKCTHAGIKSAIKVYQMGNGLKKDKEIEKLIKLDSEYELEKWIIQQLK